MRLAGYQLIRPKTRKVLESWLPLEHWPHFNLLIVGLGQAQQQQQHLLVERCVRSSVPLAALRLVAKIGLSLRASKFPALDEAARESAAIRRLLQ